MKAEEIKTRILDALQEHKSTPMTASEVAAALELRGAARKRLQKWLGDLMLAGRIVPVGKNRYALGRASDLVTGTISVARSGVGFIKDDGGDVVVEKADMGTAMPGDLVLVRLYTEADRRRAAPARTGARAKGRGRGGKKGERKPAVPEARPGYRSAKVVRVIERAKRDIVGTLRSSGRFLHVVPVDAAYKKDIYVPDAAGAKVNDRVIVRFEGWANEHVNPEGVIVEVLGPADEPSIDTVAVVRHYEFRDEFPPEVLREAEQVSERVSQSDERMDLRDRFILTVDPARARDFDDALSLEDGGEGRQVLGVHIADVAHFIEKGGALDGEAAARGNSIYFPDKVIPMLPEQLSNGVCSLKPDTDRLAFSAFLTMDAEGNVVERTFARTVIRSSKRLTYEEAMSMLEPSGAVPDDPLMARCADLLQRLDVLAQTLRRRRFARWALDMDMPECEVVMDERGGMTGFRMTVNDRSHQLIEECMVAANEAVAQELSDNGLPLISRLHEPPAPQKIEDLEEDLAVMGYAPGDLSQPRNLASFLKSIADDPLAHYLRVMVLKSMKRAMYSGSAGGHFGLAKAFYAHFTSPIRRYPDLVVHRQLARLLENRARKASRKPVSATVYSKKEVCQIGDACSITEQKADEAEMTVLEIKKYRFLSEQLKRDDAQVYDAVVVNVTNFGIFVEILDLQLQGLVHVSVLSDQYMRFDRAKRSLGAGRKSYRAGTSVRVKVTAVDIDSRRVDFALA